MKYPADHMLGAQRNGVNHVSMNIGGFDRAIGAIPPGGSVVITVPWATTPNPADFPGNDGHFCLLAFIVKATTPAFDGFSGANLSENVLRFRGVAWRNIHIVPVQRRVVELGQLVVANPLEIGIPVHVGFEVLDPGAQPIDPTWSGLSVLPQRLALERLLEHQGNLATLEDLGRDAFRVQDLATGIPRLDLRSGDVLRFGLEVDPAEDVTGYAVRAIQYLLEGDRRTVIGGQTFVAGDVAGFTKLDDPLTAG